MSTQIRAAVIGSTGYGGVELIRFLLNHPKVQITSVVSSSNAGEPISAGFPHLSDILTDSLDDVDIALIQTKADVVFTATPSGVSTTLVPKLLDAGLKVIDLSGDFRLRSGSLYEKWYKHKPADDSYLQKAVYGLADIYPDEVRGANFISNPGCYPTATLLALIPVLSKGMIDPRTIIIDAKSGVSGAGRKVGLTVHYSEMNENFLAYKVNQHQHIPEIEQELSRVAGHEVVTTFTTHLVPMTRGIMSTIYTQLTDTYSEEDILNLYRDYYKDHRFIRIRNQGKWPATKEVWGSNYCDIGVAADQRTGRLTLISVIDNVVKGAAGQAIQNLNLMMGWDEAAGLELSPVYP